MISFIVPAVFDLSLYKLSDPFLNGILRFENYPTCIYVEQQDYMMFNRETDDVILNDIISLSTEQ